jgi:hypothetical protein
VTLSLTLFCLWAVVANVAAMIPSRDRHRRRAVALIATGLPIVGFVAYETGPWIGLLTLAAGMSVLRWPVAYLMRRIGGGGDAAP